MLDENQPTTKQVVLFTVVMSFIVSVIGTVLVLGILGPIFGSGQDSAVPFLFNRPKILEKILPSEPVRQDELVVKAVEQASPAVVSVVASKDVPVLEQYFIDPFGNDPFLKQFFGDGGSGFQIPQLRQKGTQHQDVSAGTGFIVSVDGLVLTNKHVVADANAEYTVFMNDGTKKTAKVLARDPVQDLAIIKIEGSNLPTLKIGDSGHLKIGQTVIAIGNALGEFRNTVSVGVISGLQRSVEANGGASGPESLQELIQTDAAINPGNSGGPLLNIYGEVIGIDTAVAQGAQNIGFAIPSVKAQHDIDSVKKTGRIVYAFLGVRYQAVTKELAEKQKLGRDYGVLVSKSDTEPAVVAGGPADKAGIRDGDSILMVNGERIDQNHLLASFIQKYTVDDTITLKIFREGKEMDVQVKLEERK